jgi:plastocyanin
MAKRPLALGGPAGLTASWGGVAIARHTVYASVGIRGLPEGYIVAFRPGGPTDVPEDVQETAGNLGSGGGGSGGGGGGSSGSSSIVAGPGAYSTTYATPLVHTSVGGDVSFVNFDAAQHDVVADEKGADGQPVFRSKLIGFNQTAPVDGLKNVKSGTTYTFYCSLHPGMHGQLVVD